jgi:hypothetical protein
MIKTKDKKKTCPIEDALLENKQLIQKLERNNAKIKATEPVKKKALNQPQKRYWRFLKLASLGVVLLLLVSILATGIGTSFIDAVAAFFEAIDPFKQFRGEITPDNYVMF